jgi:transposase
VLAFNWNWRRGVDPVWWTLFNLEFRQKLIERMRAGRPEQLAQEFEPTAQTIRNWVAQADADGGKRPDVLTSVEREELGRLRKENREILAKATAWFAREADTTPKKSSGSQRRTTGRVCGENDVSRVRSLLERPLRVD